MIPMRMCRDDGVISYGMGVVSKWCVSVPGQFFGCSRVMFPPPGACGVRKVGSGGVAVFVDESAEAVASLQVV
jgi:hypothetical protein